MKPLKADLISSTTATSPMTARTSAALEARIEPIILSIGPKTAFAITPSLEMTPVNFVHSPVRDFTIFSDIKTGGVFGPGTRVLVRVRTIGCFVDAAAAACARLVDLPTGK